ncbi:hypothetical protein [Aliagarivorans taiwanensis]|uniref:hypothetical protein n=1 Tax=Aliagarivorans taiwanensis TaxID=561966 RepID=UPI000479447D|nr:hypothetical protein [Aliagarivorans taiwanensis]
MTANNAITIRLPTVTVGGQYNGQYGVLIALITTAVSALLSDEDRHHESALAATQTVWRSHLDQWRSQYLSDHTGPSFREQRALHLHLVKNFVNTFKITLPSVNALRRNSNLTHLKVEVPLLEQQARAKSPASQPPGEATRSEATRSGHAYREPDQRRNDTQFKFIDLELTGTEAFDEVAEFAIVAADGNAQFNRLFWNSEAMSSDLV